MTRVFAGERTFLSPVLGPVERGVLPPERRRRARRAALADLCRRHAAVQPGGLPRLYALLRFQALLPFNPAGQSAVAESLAFNTAVSFTTNTNWQSYVPRERR